METPPFTEAPITENKDERMWAMFCHLGGLAGFIFPLGNVIAPLVIWMIHRDKMPLVADQGKEAVNFEISITIYFIAAGLLIFAFIGFLLLPLVGIFWLVMLVVAAMKANEGVRYRYPLTIRFVS